MKTATILLSIAPLRPNRIRWYAVCREPPIAYFRVSTQRQQRSGLGIEARRAAIAQFAATEHLRIGAGYTEFESGKGGPAASRGLSCCQELKVQHRRFQTGSAFTRCRVCLWANGSTGAVHCGRTRSRCGPVHAAPIWLHWQKKSAD
jgi:hypothetical protein